MISETAVLKFLHVESLVSAYSKTSNNGPDNLCTTDRSLAPDWFYHSISTSEKQTLMSPRHTLANTKLPPKMDSETTPTNSFVHNANACRRLSEDCAPPSLDLKTVHYISTVAHRASLSCHGTATERSENTTTLYSTGLRTNYHAYWK